MQTRYAGTGPRAVLNDERFERWQRANMEAFDRLPPEIRLALKETGIEADCMRLEAALKTIPPFMVLEEIFKRAGSFIDGNTPDKII